MIDPYVDHETSVTTTPKMLRQFAGLCILFFGGIACWQYFVGGNEITALIFALIAGGLGIPGLLVPALIRPVFTVAMAITFPIGWVVSRLLLGLMFFGIFTPIALFFKLIGRDALHRRRLAEQTTYWRPKSTPTNVRSYFRQS